MLKFTTIKGLMLVLFMAFISSAASAQVFQEGKTFVSLGYGFGNLNKALFDTYKDYGGYKYSGSGPYFAKFEYAVSDKIGFGLNLAHINAKATYNSSSNSSEDYQSTVKWNNTSALARINIHFGDSDKFDFFWGAGLGYRFGKWNYSDNDPNTNGDNDVTFKSVIPFGFETTFGARYFFTENIGLYGEVGFAKAPIQFGLSLGF